MSLAQSYDALSAAGQMHWLGLALVAGYLLGSVPFGLILTRLAGLGDIRAIGSGNIGATNVLRTGSKKLAAATLLLDGLKGTAAVLLGKYFSGEAAGAAAGLGAFLGHLYPVWLGFKGGKGVATYIGVLLGALPIGAGIFAATWLATAFAFKYSSLAALVAGVVVPAALYLLGHGDYATFAAVLSALMLFKHRGNIARLMRGEEPRIGTKSGGNANGDAGVAGA